MNGVAKDEWGPLSLFDRARVNRWWSRDVPQFFGAFPSEWLPLPRARGTRAGRCLPRPVRSRDGRTAAGRAAAARWAVSVRMGRGVQAAVPRSPASRGRVGGALAGTRRVGSFRPFSAWWRRSVAWRRPDRR